MPTRQRPDPVARTSASWPRARAAPCSAGSATPASSWAGSTRAASPGTQVRVALAGRLAPHTSNKVLAAVNEA
jgi:hypothetical protein